MDIKEIEVMIPEKKEYGNVSTNIAMVLSRKANMNPRELAEKIKDNIEEKAELIKEIKIMGPGFINFFLEDEKFIEETIKYIENNDFKKFSTRNNSNIKISLVLDNINDLLDIDNFRAFMYMYYLSNIYRLAGYNSSKLILVNNPSIEANTSYLLFNFKGIEIVTDINRIRGSIVFTSFKNQGLFEELGNMRRIVGNTRIYQNTYPIIHTSLAQAIECTGLPRLKYSLCITGYNKEVHIELTHDKLRYIKYVYFRIKSVINILKSEGIDAEECEEIKLELLTEDTERDILNKLWEFQGVIEDTLYHKDPYRLIRYGEELSKEFYKLNNKIVFRALDREKLVALLKLLKCVKIIIGKILEILEISKNCGI